MEPDEIDVDDIVLEEDLDEALEEALSDVKTDPEELAGDVADKLGEGDEFLGVDTEDVQGIADATFQDRLEHLIHEDCDTPACNRLREELDVDPSESDANGENESDDDSGADAGDDEGEGTESEESESSSDEEPEGDDEDSGEPSDVPEHAAFPDEL